jgi:hypothetical protein
LRSGNFEIKSTKIPDSLDAINEKWRKIIEADPFSGFSIVLSVEAVPEMA